MRKLKIVQSPPTGRPLNGGHPLSKGLVASYLLNEGGGLQARDSSGYPLVTGTFTPGKLVGTTTYGVKQKGICVSFNGSTSYIPLGTQSQLNLDSTYTVCAWINTNTVAAGTKQIVSDSNAAGTLYQWGIEINRTAAKVTMIFNNTAIERATGATTLVAGTWYHVAGVLSGSSGAWTLTIYLNGVVDGTGTAATASKNAQSGAAIGRLGVGANHLFNGFIKDVKIYNRALSATEVRQIYQNSYQMFN